MLINQTIDAMHRLKLLGMADAYHRQLEQPAALELPFDERFALLLDHEETLRDRKRQTRLLRLARLRHSSACPEDIDYRHPRGLDRRLVTALAACDFIRRRQNLHITGPTGTGKSWISCAIGHAACRQGLSVRYERAARLVESLRLARGDGSLGKKLLALAKTDLLILDDFGLKPLAGPEKHDLLEVIEDRHGLRSTIITSQLPVKLWHGYLGEPTLADAILDRVLNNSHRIELAGESLRRSTPSLDNETEGYDK